MKVIFALGNAEPRYDGTRHNVGFAVADALAGRQGTSFAAKPKLKALVAEYTSGDQRILVVKPTTYYNNVGESARAIMDFYKLAPSDFLVIHDDFALPLGTIRTRIGGSGAGNNGIKSLGAHIGDDTARLRIGIYGELRDRIDDADFVLARFTRAEQATIASQLDTMCGIVNDFVSDNFQTTTLQ